MNVYRRIERGAPGIAESLRAIERAAGVRFRSFGMTDVADDEGTEPEILDDRAARGRLYIAWDARDAAVGFLIWSPKDGCAYIEEVSVHPDHAGHRLAARISGRFAAITLVTFRDIPWNAPYYATLGFTEIARNRLGPDHEESWQQQTASGLDMSRRLFMTRTL